MWSPLACRNYLVVIIFDLQVILYSLSHRKIMMRQHMVFPRMMRKSRSAWLESRVVWDISLHPKLHYSYQLFSCSWSGHASENQKLLLKLVHWEFYLLNWSEYLGLSICLILSQLNPLVQISYLLERFWISSGHKLSWAVNMLMKSMQTSRAHGGWISPYNFIHYFSSPKTQSREKHTRYFLLSTEPLQNHIRLPPLLIVRVHQILPLTLFGGKE